jgi:hypothetical protein
VSIVPEIKIGLIGSAGRKDDAAKLNLLKYQQMKAAVMATIAPYLSKPITLVSGGAAVADHIAVQLFMDLPSTKLKLHLPAQFDMARQRYVEVPGKTFDPGTVANFYHRQFQRNCQQDSLVELQRALYRGASVVVTPGFKQRNTQIAMDADVMIALTFGEGATLKDGGTADTMQKFLRANRGLSFHIDLHTMKVHSPARFFGMEPQTCQPSMTPDLFD